MISVRDAIEITLANTPRQKTIETEFTRCLGAVLAEDIVSDIDMPPFDRSMMDGYALAADDALLAAARLQVVGFIPAGSHPKFKLQPGQAAKIMTGAPLPEGADAVREVEKVRLHDQGRVVEILEPVKPGLNVVPRGAEVRAGEPVLTAGTYIQAPMIGLLAATGKVKVKIYKPPDIAILATGDELVDPHIKPMPGQIRNSNSFMLQALCARLGLKARILGVAKDDKNALRFQIAQGLKHDVLLMTGGVSMGDLDLVQDVLKELGVKLFYQKVAIKPGKPTVFGKIGDKLVFALPGNPVSSATVFEVIVRPALRKMMGYPVYQNPQVTANLTEYFANKSQRENYHPSVCWYEDGQFFCRPLETRGSGDIASFARSNAYLICPIDRTEMFENERVQVLLREDFYLT